MRTVNRFTGMCIRCGIEVPANEGVLTMGISEFTQAWGYHKPCNVTYVEHVACHERFDGTKTHYIHFPAEETSK